MPVLNYRQNKLHYYQYGNGQELLIALHGFADSGALFLHLESALTERYTVVALDLPFHGKTDWQEEVYRPEDVAAWFELLQQQFGVQKYSLMCHSMGGRVILGALPQVIEQVTAIYFLATAGVEFTFSASRLSFPLALRRFARKKLVDSNFFMRIFDYLHEWKLLNTATYTIFKMQLDLPRRRARFLRSWESLYYFPMRFGRPQFKLLNEQQTPTYFFFGIDDGVTPARKGKKVAQKLKNAHWTTTQGNHFFIKNNLVQELQSWLDTNFPLSS